MDFDKITETKSEDEEKEGKFHYFYNREERLSHAPKIVQDFYANGGTYHTKGFFKFMFEKKSTKFLFLSLVVVLAFSFAARFLQTRTYKKIAGSAMELTAVSMDDTVYPRLKLNEVSDRSSIPEEGIPVEVLFKAYESSGEVCNEEKVSKTFYGDELFIGTRFSDYDIIKVTAEVSDGKEVKELSAAVVRQ